MAHYLVGDIQGCFQPLRRLLDKVHFDPTCDHLWSVGDLVNRGPNSLETLRLLKSFGDHFRTVLGNHDLHFLAIAHGVAPAKKGDTVHDILDAEDRHELVTWLRHQPLLLENQHCLVVHAGIPHVWTLDQTRQYAREVEAVLSSQDPLPYLAKIYGNEPEIWSDQLSGGARWRVITNYLTRMRVCTPQGALNLSFKGTANEIPSGYAPWFEFHDTHSLENKTVFFGHWAALKSLCYRERFHALDSGCVWGQELTFYHLEERRRISCACG